MIMTTEMKNILGSWYLISVSGRPEIGDRVWVRFSEDGRITGHTGTHSINGRYQVDRDQLKIVRVTVMRKACMIDPTNKFEPLFLQAFENSSGFLVGENNDLKLFDKDGREVLHFNGD